MAAVIRWQAEELKKAAAIKAAARAETAATTAVTAVAAVTVPAVTESAVKKRGRPAKR